MANWTVATAYQRFQDVLAEEAGVPFDELEENNVTLKNIKDTFEKRIVKDAMAGANRKPVKPRPIKNPKLEPKSDGG